MSHSGRPTSFDRYSVCRRLGQMIKRRGFCNHRLSPEMILCMCDGSAAHSLAPILIRKIMYSCGQSFRIVEGNKKAGLAIDDLIFRTAAWRTNRNSAAGHSLRDCQTKSFKPAWQQGNIGCPIDFQECVIINKAKETKRSCIGSVFLRMRLDRGRIASSSGKQTDDFQFRIADTQLPDGFDHKVMPFVEIQSSR